MNKTIATYHELEKLGFRTYPPMKVISAMHSIGGKGTVRDIEEFLSSAAPHCVLTQLLSLRKKKIVIKTEEKTRQEGACKPSAVWELTPRGMEVGEAVVM